MIMLNFIIAIIVEAYMKVVSSIADMEADQEFCSDVTSVLFVSCKSVVFRWPGHMHIIDALQTCRKEYITYGMMRFLFPKWRRRGILSFLHHYARYDFVAPWHKKEVSENDQAVWKTVTEIEERLAVMLGVPIPTKAERLMESKRLEKIRQVLPHARMRCVVLPCVCVCARARMCVFALQNYNTNWQVERRLRLGVGKPVGEKEMKKATGGAPSIGPTLVPENAGKPSQRLALGYSA